MSDKEKLSLPIRKRMLEFLNSPDSTNWKVTTLQALYTTYMFKPSRGVSRERNMQLNGCHSAQKFTSLSVFTVFLYLKSIVFVT